MLAEGAGDGGQHARFVQGAEPEHVLAADLGHGLERQRDDPVIHEAQRRNPASGAGQHAAGEPDQVADNGAGGGVLAGAPAVEHHRADEIAAQTDGVEHAVNLGQRVVQRDHGWVDPGLNLAFGQLADGQKLDAVAELAGELDVQAADAGDPLGIDAVEVDARAEAERDQDRQLVGSIHPLDVKGRVGLGVAQFLGRREHVGEIRPLLCHAGQDVVAGAVHDADYRTDAVGGQVPLDGGQHRDAASHRGLELHLDPLAGSGGEYLVAMQGQERLVGGDDVLPLFDGLEHKALGRLVPAHQFDHHRDIGVIEDGVDVGGQAVGIDRDAPVAGDIQVRDPFQHDAGPDLAADDVRVLL